MIRTKATPPSELRARLDHPVIDTDGHMLELSPVIFDYFKHVGGPEMTEEAFTDLRLRDGLKWHEMDRAAHRR